MKVNEVLLRIECQLKNPTNYLKNNAIRICNDALRIDNLSPDEIRFINGLKIEIEKTRDPWNWNGVPSRKETELILLDLIGLKIVLEKKPAYNSGYQL